MNKFLFTTTLIINNLLINYNQLTQYTITKQKINQSLAKHNNFSKNINLPNMANTHIILTNLTNQINHKKPNKITLTKNTNLNINSLFNNQKTTIKLKLKTLPMFNKKKNTIFLKKIKIINTTIQPKKIQTIIQTLLPYLNQTLHNYFNQQPTYILHKNNNQNKTITKKLTKNIKIKPNKIIIPFTN